MSYKPCMDGFLVIDRLNPMNIEAVSGLLTEFYMSCALPDDGEKATVLEDRNRVWAILHKDNKPVGITAIEVGYVHPKSSPFREKPEPINLIHDVYIRPGFRKQGQFKIMLHALMDEVNVDKVYWNTAIVNNEGIEAFENAGFDDLFRFDKMITYAYMRENNDSIPNAN